MESDTPLTRSELRAAKKRKRDEEWKNSSPVVKFAVIALIVGVLGFLIAGVINKRDVSYTVADYTPKPDKTAYVLQVAEFKKGDADAILDKLWEQAGERPVVAQIYCADGTSRFGTYLAGGSRDRNGDGAQAEVGKTC